MVLAITDPFDAPVALDTPVATSTPKYTPLSDIQTLISGKGMTYADAGKILGISGQAVHERCQRHNIMSSRSIERFESNEISALANVRASFLQNLDTDSIKKATALQSITGYGIAFDKARLLKDLSTENVSHDVMVGSVSDAKKEYDQARDKRLAAQSAPPHLDNHTSNDPLK